jgi:hypothetical protein
VQLSLLHHLRHQLVRSVLVPGLVDCHLLFACLTPF